MKSELFVGNFIVCFKGFRRRVGRKYKVLSITLTDVYIQDVITNKCINMPIRWIKEDFVKVSEREMVDNEL